MPPWLVLFLCHYQTYNAQFFCYVETDAAEIVILASYFFILLLLSYQKLAYILPKMQQYCASSDSYTLEPLKPQAEHRNPSRKQTVIWGTV